MRLTTDMLLGSTRKAIPVSLPFRLGIVLPTLATTVDIHMMAGIMLAAASAHHASPLRRDRQQSSGRRLWH